MIQSTFKRLDFLSVEVSLLINGYKRYKNLYGSFLSIIIISASITLAFLFGSEIYKRQVPIVSQSSEYTSSSVVKMNEYFFFYTFKDYNEDILTNPFDYFGMISYKENYTNSKQIFGNYPKSHNVTKCNETHFKTFKDKISDEEIDTFVKMPTFCMNYLDNYDGYFENPYSTPNSTFLDIDISFKKYTDDAKPDRYDKIIQESYISVYFLNSYVSSIDYNNPVKYYLDNVKQQISIRYLKRIFLEIGHSSYISDNGWILEDKSLTDFFYLSQLRYETVDRSSLYYDDICWITFSSPFIIQNYNRQYLKVQDLFAKIGGLINALIILTNLIFMHFLRFEYTKRIFESILSAKEKQTQLQSYLSTTNNIEQRQPTVNLLNSNKLLNFAKHSNKDIKQKDRTSRSPRALEERAKAAEAENIQIKNIKTNNFTERNKQLDTNKTCNTSHAAHVDYSYYKLLGSVLCCSKKTNAEYDYMYSTVNHVLEVTSYINSVIASDYSVS